MNLVLSIDDRLAEEALAVARTRGTSLEQMIADALAQITSVRSGEGVLAELEERGIDGARAADLRARLQTFAEDWDSPDMDVYDAYEKNTAP